MRPESAIIASSAEARQSPAPVLSIVIPTFNERDNVALLIASVEAVLADMPWEIIFVDDDSPDGTVEAARKLAASDTRIRCIQRIGRRGLSTAVIEGCLASSATFLAVMDGDLQHPASVLKQLYDKLRGEDLDLVVASRFADGSDIGDFSSRRQMISRAANALAHALTRVELSDPMSGFFVMRRDVFLAAVRGLSGQGFKILLDILASSPVPLKLGEVPFSFGKRLHGTSKLDSSVFWDHLTLLLDKTVGRFVPVRFVMFSIVGALGVFVHFAVLSIALMQFAFVWAQGIATGTTIVANFLINNVFTFRDRRLRGLQMLRGLISFMLVCSVGAVANVGVAAAIFGMQYSAWISALCGILVGAVWNYAMSSLFTWR